MPAFKAASLMWKVMAGTCLVYMKTGSRIGVGGRGEAFQYLIILTYHTKPFHIRRISPLNLYVDHSPLAVRFPYSFPLPFEYSLLVRSFPLFVGNLLGNRLQYYFIRLLCYLFYFPGSPLSFPLPPQDFFVNNFLSFTFLSYTTSTVLCQDLYDTIFLSSIALDR